MGLTLLPGEGGTGPGPGAPRPGPTPFLYARTGLLGSAGRFLPLRIPPRGSGGQGVSAECAGRRAAGAVVRRPGPWYRVGVPAGRGLPRRSERNRPVTDPTACTVATHTASDGYRWHYRRYDPPGPAAPA